MKDEFNWIFQIGIDISVFGWWNISEKLQVRDGLL